MLPVILLALASAPVATSPPPPPAPSDFSVVVPQVVRTARGVQVTMAIANLPGAPRLFAHLEPYATDPAGVIFAPPAMGGTRPVHDRSTFFLSTGGSRQVAATLLFELEAECNAAVLVVGEAAEPYRQSAIALDLAEARTSEPPPSPEPLAAAPELDRQHAVASFKPPALRLGARVVLPPGRSGPSGYGWARIYTELPEVSLDTVTQAIERPHQVWGGNGAFAYLLRLDANKAIALEVRNGEIQRARLLTRSMFEHFVGAGTPYPQRLYVAPS